MKETSANAIRQTKKEIQPTLHDNMTETAS